MADTHRRVAPLPAAVRVAARRGLGAAAATEAAYFWARPPALEMRWVVLVRTRYFCFVLSCFPGSSHLSALFLRVNMKCDLGLFGSRFFSSLYHIKKNLTIL